MGREWTTMRGRTPTRVPRRRPTTARISVEARRSSATQTSSTSPSSRRSTSNSYRRWGGCARRFELSLSFRWWISRRLSTKSGGSSSRRGLKARRAGPSHPPPSPPPATRVLRPPPRSGNGAPRRAREFEGAPSERGNPPTLLDTSCHCARITRRVSFWPFRGACRCRSSRCSPRPVAAGRSGQARERA